MEKSRPDGSRIRAEIGDVTRSQVAIGHGIHQESHTAAPPTAAELDQLRDLLARLRAQVGAEAPPESRDAALAKVDELEEALAQPEPDLATMESVRNWFVRRLPALAAGVAGLVVHPIVGKLVGAAGDSLAAEFRRRFGG